MFLKDKYFDKIHGIEVIAPDVLSYAENRDSYIMVCSTIYFQEIKREAIGLGFQEKCVIPIDVFNMPYFDFMRYVNLIENPVSIVAMDCYGAFVYNYLRLPFMSPFILCFVGESDYIRLYIHTELRLYEGADIGRGTYPKGYLGDSENKIVINFNHHASFEEAKYDWNRRLKRMQENMLITMAVLDKGMQNVLTD